MNWLLRPPPSAALSRKRRRASRPASRTSTRWPASPCPRAKPSPPPASGSTASTPTSATARYPSPPERDIADARGPSGGARRRPPGSIGGADRGKPHRPRRSLDRPARRPSRRSAGPLRRPARRRHPQPGINTALADRLADEAIADASRVAGHALAVRNLAAKQAEHADQARELEAVKADCAKANAAWQALWANAGIKLLAPAEMLGWPDRSTCCSTAVASCSPGRRRSTVPRRTRRRSTLPWPRWPTRSAFPVRGIVGDGRAGRLNAEIQRIAESWDAARDAETCCRYGPPRRGGRGFGREREARTGGLAGPVPPRHTGHRPRRNRHPGRGARSVEGVEGSARLPERAPRSNPPCPGHPPRSPGFRGGCRRARWGGSCRPRGPVARGGRQHPEAAPRQGARDAYAARGDGEEVATARTEIESASAALARAGRRRRRLPLRLRSDQKGPHRERSQRTISPPAPASLPRATHSARLSATGASSSCRSRRARRSRSAHRARHARSRCFGRGDRGTGGGRPTARYRGQGNVLRPARPGTPAREVLRTASARSSPCSNGGTRKPRSSWRPATGPCSASAR